VEFERIQEVLALLTKVTRGQREFEQGNTIPAVEMPDELETWAAENLS
jgi:hypothetical protein